MKQFLGLAGLVLIGTVGWRIGDALSSDAISMALGIFFGILAGIPAALLVLAAERQREHPRSSHRTTRDYQTPPAQAIPQPPVIVLNGAGGSMPLALPRSAGQPATFDDYFAVESHAPHYANTPAHYPDGGQGGNSPGIRPPRRFKVVGEREEWLE